MTQAKDGKTRLKRGTRPPRRSARAAPRRRTGQSGLAQRIIDALPVQPATLQRIVNAAVAVTLVVALGFAAHISGATAKAQEEWAAAVARAGFTVQRVEVVGADRIDYLRIYDAALGQQDRSMAAVDLDEVRRQVMQYGWVKDARVSRRLPDTLVIDVVERAPAAVWQQRQTLALIDADGVVLEGITRAQMPDLPLLIGPGANRRAQDLAKLLDSAASLRPLLASAAWVGNRRWDLRFDSGEMLMLPEGEAAAKKALVRFTHLDGTNRLLGRGILRFDMRDPANFVMRLPTKGQMPARQASASAPVDIDASPMAEPARPSAPATEG